MSEQGFQDLAAWPAPAKINRFLHITGRRSDGYHELQTVFQFLDIGDELRFRVRDDGQITRVNDLPGIPADEDLVIKAARLLQQDTGCTQGADILVTKKLPMGGGLGGGSSDAATTLVALNELWQLGQDEDHLAGLGLQLGADVPVFVRGHSAWAEGVGEHLEPVTLAEPWYLVLVPEVSVSTADLFNDPQLTRDLPPLKIRDFLAAPDRESFCDQCCNVFEPLVRKRHREIDEAINWLGKFSRARLTGTGACVFAPFEEESRAREVGEQVQGRWGFIVARGCNRSPLFTRSKVNR
ncbi:4-(cytidine 5'-diphospho)-2-C-methyl-D-erythritol kinase [Kaarinaea lacus]